MTQEEKKLFTEMGAAILSLKKEVATIKAIIASSPELSKIKPTEAFLKELASDHAQGAADFQRKINDLQ